MGQGEDGLYIQYTSQGKKHSGNLLYPAGYDILHLWQKEKQSISLQHESALSGIGL